MSTQSLRNSSSPVRNKESALSLSSRRLFLPEPLLRLIPYLATTDEPASLSTARASKELWLSGLAFFNISLFFGWATFFEVNSDYFLWTNWISFALCLGAASFCLLPLIQLAAQGLKNRRLRAESLLASGVILSLAVGLVLQVDISQASSQLNFKWPQRHSFIFLNLSLLLLVLSCWRFALIKLVSYLEHNFTSQLERNVEQVRCLESFDEANADSLLQSSQALALAELREGDIIVVREGDYIPCDGFVISGVADLEERKLGRPPVSVVRSKGQQVYGASRLSSGVLVIKANSTSEDCQYSTFFAELLDRMRISSLRSAALEKWYSLMSWGVVFLSCSAAIYWRDLGLQPVDILLKLGAILMFALLPATLVLSVYLAPLVQLAIFERGALLQSAQVLKRLARLKSLVMAFEPGLIQIGNASQFELVDTRVDRGSFLSAAIAILSASKSPFAAPIRSRLREQLTKLVPFEARDVQDFDDQGVTASISGAEFSIGTEDFLIERGVYLQSSELGVDQEQGQWIYFAVGPDIIARILLSAAAIEPAGSVVQKLRRLGLKIRLYNLADYAHQASDVDQAGKTLGFELPEIESELSPEVFAQRLESLAPAGLMHQQGFPTQLIQRAEVSLSGFEELHWNMKGSDVVLFTSNLEILSQIRSLARSFERLQWLSIGALGLLSITCLFFAFLGTLSAVGVSLSMICMFLTIFMAFLALVLPQARSRV